MSTQEPKKRTVIKNYARQSTRGRGRPKNEEAPVYLQTGFAPHVHAKLQRLAKSKGVNEGDIIRLVVANALESLFI